jgi:hypothetical protein
LTDCSSYADPDPDTVRYGPFYSVNNTPYRAPDSHPGLKDDPISILHVTKCRKYKEIMSFNFLLNEHLTSFFSHTRMSANTNFQQKITKNVVRSGSRSGSWRFEKSDPDKIIEQIMILA